jgi:glycosyltransferase involved in cell wall biosynthesis
VVPVHNEERDLERSIRRLRAYLDACFPFHTTVTVADNASTEATPEIGRRLAAQIAGVRYMRVSDRGRGRAIASSWLVSRAEVVVQIAGNPSAHLEALLPLVAPVASGHSELAVGVRVKQDLVSRAYIAFLMVGLGARLADSHCTLTAIRGDIARRLVPQVEDRDGFFRHGAVGPRQKGRPSHPRGSYPSTGGSRHRRVPARRRRRVAPHATPSPEATKGNGGGWRLGC